MLLPYQATEALPLVEVNNYTPGRLLLTLNVQLQPGGGKLAIRK
jgi:hypothetical protein